MLKKIIVLLNIFFCFFSHAKDITNNEVAFIEVFYTGEGPEYPTLKLIITDNKIEIPLNSMDFYGQPEEVFHTKKQEIPYPTNLFKQAPQELIQCSNNQLRGVNDIGGVMYVMVFRDGHINHCGIFESKEWYPEELKLFSDEVENIIWKKPVLK